MINTKTKLIGLLGKSLGHSYSTIMHNEAYRKNNLNYLYLPIEIEEENIKKLLEGMKQMNFIGFNVTIPHKIKIIEYLDDIDSLAKKIGSVNTVKITKGKLKGYNTDGIGFLSALRTKFNINISESKFLLLGSGGACRAISMTLGDSDAKEIYIANRTLSKAKSLSNDVELKCGVKSFYIDFRNYEKMKEIISKVDIIINTTSLGMYPNINEIPINENLLLKKHLVVDIVYNPIKTKLLIAAEKKGCKIQNGIDMLINQGAEAFKIWTNSKLSVEEMKNTIYKNIK